MRKVIKIKSSQLKTVISEAINREIYFDSFSEAVQHARSEVEKRGFEIDQDDWWSEISVGPGRPKDGQTTRASIGLYKSGKPQKKGLHIQVYNRGLKFENNYELNYYIS